MRIFKFLIVLWFPAILFAAVDGSDQSPIYVLKAHFRHRPPEMVVSNNNFYGPLKDIIEYAAKRSRAIIEWEQKPFKDSLEDLKNNKVDIVPRVFFNESRKTFIKYLGPIGYKKQDIVFLVTHDNINLIENENDLNKLTIGVKAGTLYTDDFDNNKTLDKVYVKTDKELALLFKNDDVDTVILTDKSSMIDTLKELQINDYTFAKHRQQHKRYLYYASPLNEAKTKVIINIEDELKTMTDNGTIELIYARNNLPPPYEITEEASKPPS